jgi:hypothetical protein
LLIALGNQVAENFILPNQRLNVGDLTMHGAEMRVRRSKKKLPDRTPQHSYPALKAVLAY